MFSKTLRLLIRDEFTNAKVRKKSKWEHVLTIKFLFHLKYNRVFLYLRIWLKILILIFFIGGMDEVLDLINKKKATLEFLRNSISRNIY